jgi:magnesium and cobalt transporter
MGAFEKGQLSRLPVYRETLDDPIGFVHLKDIALTYGVGAGAPKKAFRVSEHIRKALFVPPSMRIAALLQRMQAARVHMALVIDEFGGVDGLVTIEDLVEQIVGDIEDEHDSEDAAQWTEEAPGVYVINARADIREFEEAEGVHLLPSDWEEDVDTFGGLVFMLTGRVPNRGEVIAHPSGHEFEITDADARRIKRLRLTLQGAGQGVSAGAREAAE